MIMSFAAPLGVGVTSSGEYFDMEVQTPLSTADFGRRFNAVMAEGIRVMSVREIPDQKASKAMSLVAAADYYVDFREGGNHHRITENGFPVLWHSVPLW